MVEKNEKYQLIKTYPGFPALGVVITVSQLNQLGVDPVAFPEYWVKLTDIKMYKDAVGNFVELYDLVYFIVNERAVERKLFENDKGGRFYKELGDALLDPDCAVHFETEDGLVNSDCTLYGLVPRAQWETCVTSARKEYRRQVLRGGTQTAWLYFKSQQAREAYIRWNKPQYSLDEIRELLSYYDIDEEFEEFEEFLNELQQDRML